MKEVLIPGLKRDSTMKLSQNAQEVLAEVAVQCQRGDEYLHTLGTKIEVKHTKYALIGLPSEPEATLTEQGMIGPFGGLEKQGQISSVERFSADLLPLLAGRDYDRQELPSIHAGELRVRVTRNRGEGDSGDYGILDGSDIKGVDFLFFRKPVQLVQVQLHPPILPHFMRFFIERVEMEIQFGYVLEVPLPVKARVRIRSRGMGRLRIDQERVTVITYEAAQKTGPQPDGLAGGFPRG
jgi:hypothetical protein